MIKPPGAVVGPVEQALVEAYLEAIKKSVTSIDSVAEKTLGAAFSIATAYGALIGLVAPKEEPNGLLVAVPFGFTAGAAVLAMLALSVGVKPTPGLTSGALNSFQGLRDRKRLFNFAALGVLTLAIAGAAVVIITSYGPRSEPIEPGTIVVRASSDRVDVVTVACEVAEGSVFGDIHVETLDDPFVLIEVGPGNCQRESAVSLQLPADQISAIEYVE